MVGHSLRAPLGIRLPRIVRAVAAEVQQNAPRSLRPDRFFELANGEYAHFEFQTNGATRADMDRFLEYDGLMWRRVHRRIHTVVFYAGRPVRTAPGGAAAGSITYRVTNVFLNRMDGEAVLAGLEAKVRARRALAAGDHLRLALCMLMRHERGALLGAARRAAVLLRSVADARAREVCGWAAYGAAAEVGASRRVLDELSELMEMAGMTRLRDHLIATGEAKGREEGREEGREDGRAEGRAESLLIVLRARHGHAAEPLAPRIRGERRTPVLDRWLELAAEAPTLEAFVRAMEADAAPQGH